MSSAHQDDAPPRSAVPIADLSALDAALAAGGDQLKETLKLFRPADVGRDLNRRNVDQGSRIIAATDDRHAAAMLRSAHPSIAARNLATVPVERVAHILGYIPTDHLVAIFGAMDAEVRSRIEQALDPEDKKTIDRLLAHPQKAVGRLMTPRIWRCERTRTAGEAMADLAAHTDDIEVAVNCYVVDGRKLVGVVPLREMSIAPPATPIEKIMTRDPIAVAEDSDRVDAAEIIQTHDFLSLPIVDQGGNLVGAVRVDDLFDSALGKLGAGLLNQGAVAGKVAAQVPYFMTSLPKVVRSRITWLILLFVAETLTGTVLRFFEDELAKVVALSFFVPLLIGTGGNAGSQTVSTVIRALALGEVRVRDVLRVVFKEVSAGVTLGLLLGTIAFFRALLWGVGSELALCVSVTILVVCTWANTVGAVIPLAAQRLGIDPTVVSAPLITTLVDASGLCIYFLVAHLTISTLHNPPHHGPVPAPAEMAELYPLEGEWSCNDAAGVKGQLQVEEALDKHWLDVAYRGEGATERSSQEVWGYDPAAHHFVISLVDDRGALLRLEAPGWQGDRMEFAGESGGFAVSEVLERQGKDAIRVSGREKVPRLPEVAWTFSCKR